MTGFNDYNHNSSWWTRNTVLISTLTAVVFGAIAGIVYFKNRRFGSQKSKVKLTNTKKN